MTVRYDPRVQISDGDRRAKAVAMTEVGGWLEQLATAYDKGRRGLEGAGAVTAALKARGRPDADLHSRAEAVAQSLTQLTERIAQQRRGGPLGGGPDPLGDEVRSLYGSLDSSWDAPTQTQQLRMSRLRDAVRDAAAALDEIVTGAYGDLRQAAAQAGLDVVPDLGS